MILLFDMDGTLTEPWYGKNLPHFYANPTDVVTRSTISNTYQYVRVLPHIPKFLESAKSFFDLLDIPLELGVVSRIVNGKEYLDKVDYLTRELGFESENIYGAISEEDKLTWIEYKANQDEVIYFDDTISTLNKISANVNAKNHVMVVHAMSLLVRDIQEIYNAYIAEQTMPKFKYFSELENKKEYK